MAVHLVDQSAWDSIQQSIGIQDGSCARAKNLVSAPTLHPQVQACFTPSSAQDTETRVLMCGGPRKSSPYCLPTGDHRRVDRALKAVCARAARGADRGRGTMFLLPKRFPRDRLRQHDVLPPPSFAASVGLSMVARLNAASASSRARRLVADVRKATIKA